MQNSIFDESGDKYFQSKIWKCASPLTWIASFCAVISVISMGLTHGWETIIDMENIAGFIKVPIFTTALFTWWFVFPIIKNFGHPKKLPSGANLELAKKIFWTMEYIGVFVLLAAYLYFGIVVWL